MSLTQCGHDSTIVDVPYQPTHLPTATQIKRRRILAALVICLLICSAAAIGVAVQKATGWSKQDWARYNSVQEPADYPQTGVIIPLKPLGETATIKPVSRSSNHKPPLANAPAPGKAGSVFLESSGVQRRAYLQVPPSATPDNPVPLVLAFHGYRETPGTIAKYSGLDAAWRTKKTDGAIVVFPEGLGEAWEGAPYAKTSKGQDIQLVRDLLDQLSATYNIDNTRVYAAGMSNGGGFALKLACEMPDQFTAIASVAGAYYPGMWRDCAEKGSNPDKPDTVHFAKGATTPFLEIHGKKDQTIEYQGGRRHSTPYLAAVTLTGHYAARSGCFGAPLSTPATDKVTRMEWPGCKPGGEVMHLSLDDGGHTWPGDTENSAGSGEVHDASPTDKRNPNDRTSRAIPATNEILSFFERHRRVIE